MTEASSGSMLVSRIIKAPRKTVYHAFLDPEAVASWLAPDNMRARVHTFDPCEGGKFRIENLSALTKNDELKFVIGFTVLVIGIALMAGPYAPAPKYDTDEVFATHVAELKSGEMTEVVIPGRIELVWIRIGQHTKERCRIMKHARNEHYHLVRLGSPS